MKNTLLICAAFVFGLTGYSQSLDDSLQFYLKFDNNLMDHSPNHLISESKGGTYVADRNGATQSAYQFNGVSDYINLPPSPILQPQLPITVSFWTKPTDLIQDHNKFFYLADDDDVHSGIWITLSYEGRGGIEIGYGDHTASNASGRRSATSRQALSTGIWQHVTCVINGPFDMRVYINGQESEVDYSGHGGLTPIYGNFTGRIGASFKFSDRYSNGAIDEVALWTRALNAEEAAAVYNGMPMHTEEKVVTTHELPRISLFPNPTAGVVNFKMEDESAKEVRVNLYDMTGKLVSSQAIFNGNGIIDLNGFSKGMYICTVVDVNGLLLHQGKISKH